ncbi:type VII secretion integral membrane protein EccD [Mycobacterium malmoense]|uniref:type VII secretion integral membrane protein EccD n=1 Tax=Mycobacterium malmoense TaxID=1780 RepID=UPI00080B96B9|nr:type VII secretion integral membrane protein EccD [Mycobacterium malmoense]OCB23648.1 type VII secretion integral membrane protein EccD [Mycobacterium malmoense]
MFAAFRPKGPSLPATDPTLRRVSIHSGSTAVDLSLPAEIPVAVLTPSIVDVLHVRDAGDASTAKRYHLSLPGSSALDPSKTLAQSGIADGAVLLLGRSSAPPPAVRHHDVAEAVCEALAAAPEPWAAARRRLATRVGGVVTAACMTGIGALALVRNALHGNGGREPHTTVAVAVAASVIALLSAVVAHRAYRDAAAGLALNAMAAAFAAVAGVLAVPGGPGACKVLLGATAAAVTAVLAIRASGCGLATLTAVSCAATVVAAAALVGVITTAPLRAIGAASALVSVGLLGAAARVSIAVAGLSPRLPATPDTDPGETTGTCVAARAHRADGWLSSLLAGFSAAAAVGAVVSVLAGAPRLSCVAFGGITGALLLLRARTSDGAKMLASASGGILVLTTTFGAAAMSTPGHGAWVAAATGTLAAAAIFLGFFAPDVSLPPLVHRSVDALEWLALVAMVPLACWICGLYGAVRGMNLT